MTKKKSMVGCLVLVVALIFVTTSVYGGAREVRERYGPGYEKWIGTLIPEEFEFGPEDEVGRLNWMNPASVLQAVRLVKKGKVYDLAFTVDRYSPNWPGHPPFEMITFRSPFGERNQGDQGWMAPENNAAGIAFASEATIHCQHTGTHMDNIAHVVFGPNACGYNGISLNKDLGDFGLLKGGSETVPPVVCRGIMLDMPAYKGMKCLPAGYEITIDDLKGCMRKQGVSIKKGDCVLMRTGNGQNWPDKKKSTIGPGPGWKAVKWMMDNGVMLAGTDTVAYEVQPTPNNMGPVGSNPHPGHMCMFHHGAHIMEFVNMEELAKDRVYEFLFMTSPNKFRGATGSNIRPIAIN
jgi:kynurenine formamidase